MSRRVRNASPTLPIAALVAAAIGIGLVASAGHLSSSMPTASANEAPSGPSSNGPSYDDQGRLIRPEGWERWVFLGTTLGRGYEEEGGIPRLYSNVYADPVAYDAFLTSGSWPEESVFVLSVYEPVEETSPQVREGVVQGRLLGIEAAVKDSSRNPAIPWAYYMFLDFSRPGTMPDVAAAMPNESCGSCHAEHAQTDQVFTQFYPVLRDR